MSDDVELEQDPFVAGIMARGQNLIVGYTPDEHPRFRLPGLQDKYARILVGKTNLLEVDSAAGIFLDKPVEGKYSAAGEAVLRHTLRKHVAGVPFSTDVGERVIVCDVPVLNKKTDVSDPGIEELQKFGQLVFEGTRREFEESIWYDVGFKVVSWFIYDKYRHELFTELKGRDSDARFLVLQFVPSLERTRQRRKVLGPAIKADPKPKVRKQQLLAFGESLRRWSWGLLEVDNYMTMDTVCNRLSEMMAKFSIIHGPFAYRQTLTYLALLRTYRASTSRSHLTSGFCDWADEELATPAVRRLLGQKKFVEGSFDYPTSEYSKTYQRRLKREEAEAARKAQAEGPGRRKARTVAEALGFKKGGAGKTPARRSSGKKGLASAGR